MTRILLIRHGFSTANAEDRFAGHSDFPLSETGQEQARRAAEYLFRTEKIDKIYSSDLSRAWQTAKPIAEKFGLEIIPDRRLREIYAGEWEGMRFLDIIKEDEKHFSVWINNFAYARCRGGESVGELYARATMGVLSLAKENDGKCILLASHATPLRAVHCFASGRPASAMGEFDFPTNASIQIYRYENGTLTPERLNIVDHLDGLITALPRGV